MESSFPCTQCSHSPSSLSQLAYSYAEQGSSLVLPIFHGKHVSQIPSPLRISHNSNSIPHFAHFNFFFSLCAVSLIIIDPGPSGQVQLSARIAQVNTKEISNVFIFSNFNIKNFNKFYSAIAPTSSPIYFKECYLVSLELFHSQLIYLNNQQEH